MKNENQLTRNDPEYLIGGMLFSYQKALDAFVERDVPSNKIMMADLWEDNTWTQFFFDNRTRNIYTGGFPDGKRPVHVQLVILPSLPYYCERLGIRIKDHHEKQAELKNERQHTQEVTQNQRIQKKGRRI